MLVPDEIVERVVRERLDQHDWNYGFVLDGFPRTRAQAEYLFENWNLDKVIYLELSDEVVFQRVMYRAKMGQGSGFTKRADDNPDALMIRLREYHEKTKPLLELYAKLGMLITVDASKSISEIYSDMKRKLGVPDVVPEAGL
jgi:adenylate kinase